MPTLLALQNRADSQPHSLGTWGTWLGAPVTMAAWLYERTNRVPDRAACVNPVNAVMCGWTVALIASLRWA